ncbi:hypothetical protein GCM10027047_34370 [Rhodococcus aerolatus]
MSQVPPAGQNPSPRRRRFAPVALIAGVAATGALALATTGTLSAFTAQIQNTVDTAASGTLTMQEIGSTATCNSTDAGTGTPANSINTNTATCATINKYGGSTTLVPGGAASTTTVTLKNTGTVAANSFTMAYGSCANTANVVGSPAAPTGSGNLCDQLTIAVTTGAAPGTAVTAASGTATSLAGKTVTLPAPVAPGASVVFNFSVSLPLAADNTYQNRAASQPITWTFTA